MNKLPVVYRYAISGWVTVGHAATIQEAQEVILASDQMSQFSKSLLKKGWKLDVWRRTKLEIELFQGPDGFTWELRPPIN